MKRLSLIGRLLNVVCGESFRSRLTLMLTASILALAVSTSLLTGWLITKRLQALIIDYVVHMTDQFAANSVFAFLVDDVSVAEQALANFRAFPGIHYAAILKSDHSPLVAEGDSPNWTLAEHAGIGQQGPALAGEDDRYWHFVAPVDTRPVVSPYEDSQLVPERLGYIHIAWDKTPLTSLKMLIFVINFGISLGFAGFLIAWLRLRIYRLTRPLSELVNVMSRAQRHETDARAHIAGPEETQEMARGFNGLMEKLEQQQASLESEVAIRTLELREARDAALTAARHKSEFMAAITHEMRTPLHAITGYTQLVIEEIQFLEDQERAVEWLTTVLQAANELLFRINQILDLARAEAGKLEVRLTRVDLQQVVARVTETINPLLLNHRNTLRVVSHGRPEFLTDRDKLSQILLNLLTNACKFTQDGSITLYIQCSEQALVIEVVDTGIGIPPAQQALIFEPFRQVDMSDTRKYQGTGLGLAITKQFCELLGGTIAVQSQVGVGSTFTVTLPLPLQSPHCEAQSSPERHNAAAASGTPEAPPDGPALAAIDKRE